MNNWRGYGPPYGSKFSGRVRFHGLENQGATCYLNSVLQVLFRTQDFRQEVKSHTKEKPNKEYIDLELSDLFDDLEKYTAYTYKITRKLSIDKVYEQKDAAEYFEKILCLTSPEASKIFHGVLINRNTCSECKTNIDIPAPFWYLPLALVDSYGDYSVEKGIQDFFRPSELSGENRMYCERCDDKSDATLECVIEQHPEVLVLLLKRFEFDYRYMTYVKISCAVNVPFRVQIPQNRTYELYAVVDHFGDLRRGHYTTTIRPQDDDRWYEFDDTRVSECHFQPFQVDSTERLRNAYLLFYRKQKDETADTSSQDMGVISTPEAQQVDIGDENEQRETEDLKTTDAEKDEEAANTDAAASVSTQRDEDVGNRDISPSVSVGSKRPAASPEQSCNQDGEGDVGRWGKPHRQEGNENEYPGRTQIKKQREDENVKGDDEPHGERRSEEGSVGDVSQNVDTNCNFTKDVSGSHAGWGHDNVNKPHEVGHAEWRATDEKETSEAGYLHKREERQKNEGLEHVGDQGRQKLDPNPVFVQIPGDDQEIDVVEMTSAQGQAARFSRKSELGEVVENQEEKKKYYNYEQDVSDVYYQQSIVGLQTDEKRKAVGVNRDDVEAAQKRNEGLDDDRDNVHEDPKFKKEKRADDKAPRKLLTISDLYNDTLCYKTKYRLKEGISNNNTRCDQQREDRKDVKGVGEGEGPRGDDKHEGKSRRNSNSVKRISVKQVGEEEVIKYEIRQNKGCDLRDRSRNDKLKDEEKDKKKSSGSVVSRREQGEKLDVKGDEQRSRGDEQSRGRSGRANENNGRFDNPRQSRSQERRFSPTQMESERSRGQGGSARVSGDPYETQPHGRTGASSVQADVTKGESHLKSEATTSRSSNRWNNEANPERTSEALGRLSGDMQGLNLTQEETRKNKTTDAITSEDAEQEASGENGRKEGKGNGIRSKLLKRKNEDEDMELEANGENGKRKRMVCLCCIPFKKTNKKKKDNPAGSD